MTHVRFVVDGPRDERALTALVRTTVGSDFESSHTNWRSIMPLQVGLASTLTRKLMFARRSAMDLGADALVATVDTDKTKRGARLAELEAGRTEVGFVPTAIGEATPHAEAWLLDDPKAVREALGLKKSVNIPAPTKCDPKSELERICDTCEARQPGQSVAELLAEIAKRVNASRCTHENDTGFAGFHADVTRVLSPLFT